MTIPARDLDWHAPQTIDDDTKRAKIRQYFAPDRGPKPSLFVALGVGALFVLLLLSYFAMPGWSDVAAAIAAVVLFAIAWVSFNERAQRATDDDIDIWRDEDFDAVVAEVSADAAFNADDLIDPDYPIVIAGLPRFKNLKVHHSHDDGTVPQSWRVKVKVGADGITRYTPPCLTVLHFTKDHLIAYQCDLDLLNGKRLNEITEEYFWQDIVSLQIEKQTLAPEHEDAPLYDQLAEAMPDDKSGRFAAFRSEEAAVLPTGKRTTLRLKTNAGGGLEIVIADERYVDNPDDDSLQARNAKAVARLRKLLRDRKVKR